MKKYLSLILVLALSLSLFGAVSFAEEQAYDINKLAVSELKFTNASGASLKAPAAGQINVSCTVEKIDKNDGETVNFIFFTVVRKNGKIVSRDANEYTVSGQGKVYPATNVTVPSDTSGVSVECFFWNSLSAAKSLAPKATLGSSDNELLAVYIDGKEIPFDGSETLNHEFIASLSHEPEIIAVAKNSAASVSVDKITRFPQNVKIKITPSSGTRKTYTLKTSLAEGKITDAWMITDDNVKQAIGTELLSLPDYGTDSEGNPIAPPVGAEYESIMPVNKTLVFSDRVMYYVDYPAEFRDAYAVQTAMQLFRYHTCYSKTENALAKMGNFTINRSANIYLYLGGGLDWAKADGYTRVTDANVKMYYTGQKDKNPLSQTAYKKTVIVPEGETVDIRIGNYKSADGTNADYFFVVDFIDPTAFFGVSDISIDGVSDFVFNSNKYEYDIDLAEGITAIPDIYYTLAGIGATAEITGDTTVPGSKTLKVTGVSGETLSYKFNFKTFENVLNDIKVNGTSVDGFDKYTYEYTYALPFGWKAEDGFPTVTTEQSSFVNVAMTNATAETMKTVIDITADMGTPKTYVINFVETLTRPSVEKTMAFGWNTGLIKDNANVYSASEQTNKDGTHSIHRYSAQFIAAFNQNPTWSGYTPVMGYVQLDLSKIATDLDLDKPVLLRLCSKFTFYDKATNSAPFSDGKVTLYDMSGFDWANADLTTRALAENLSAVEGKPEIATFTADDVPNDTKLNTKDIVTHGTHDVDITTFVKSCIESGNLTPTIGIYVHKPANRGQRNRIVYSLYKLNTSAMSYIVYNKFE